MARNCDRQQEAHIRGGDACDHFFGFLTHGFWPDDKDAIEIAFFGALFELTLHQFIAGRQNHVAPDTLDARFGEQSLHFVFKFLANEEIFHDSYDQNLPELRHGLVCENPTVNNLCTSA
jgi:hypothetical protein